MLTPSWLRWAGRQPVREPRWWPDLTATTCPGVLERIALWALGLAALGYGAAVAAHRRYWELLGRWTPPVPSICVGNITLGGTGKTTFVREIALRLAERGRRVAILMRGYGRAGAMTQRIAHDGVQLLATPAEVGDEAVMLGESLGHTAVVVGASRVRSAEQAVQELGAEVLVLDDGLQHWRIRPHLSLALWDATEDPLGARMFPRGRLREPLAALRYCDVIALTRADLPGIPATTAQALERASGGRPVLRCAHRPVALRAMDGATLPPNAVAGERVLAASSLGNPRALRATLELLGASVVGERAFPDHHLYSEEDVRSIAEDAQALRAAMIVVTEKDVVKLRNLPCAAHFWALTVTLQLLDHPTRPDPLDALLDRLVV